MWLSRRKSSLRLRGFSPRPARNLSTEPLEHAYYSAYHAANELEKSFPARSAYVRANVGDHESLFLLLEHPNAGLDYELRIISLDIGAQLRMLRPFRKLATYEIANDVTITGVEEAMAAAKDIVAECGKGKRKVAVHRAAPPAAA